jgi:AcrR family transcriptional regulator
VCNNIRVARKYHLKRRAERLDETRQRIVDAAIDLHTTIGVSGTTVSAIAEQAGVERHTVYRHFPDERSLGLACSACYADRYPLPDPSGWEAIADPEQRLRRGLTELYAYYAERGAELAPIVRELDTYPLTREVFELRFGPALGRIRDVLGRPLRLPKAERPRLDAVLGLFLDVTTYRAMSRSAPADACVDAAVRAILAQRR